jgi:hypothetical protein
VFAPVLMCTSIGLPVFERRKSVDPPTDKASPAPSNDSPPPSARASISGISPNSLQRPISSASAVMAAVSSSPVFTRRSRSSSSYFRISSSTSSIIAGFVGRVM